MMRLLKSFGEPLPIPILMLRLLGAFDFLQVPKRIVYSGGCSSIDLTSIQRFLAHFFYGNRNIKNIEG
jgi:hypothetical protein